MTRRIISAVAVVAIIGGLGWRMRSHSLAPAGVAGSSPASEAALQRETERHPRNPEPWRQLGEYYLSQHQPFEAVWSLQEAVDCRPGDVPTLIRLARALENAQLYRPAIDTLSDVLHRAPDNPEARDRLAQLYVRVGEPKPAIAALRGAGQRLNTWPQGLLTLGRARQLDGDIAGAGATFRRHLEISPNSAEGAIRLARALLEQGQMDPARRVLQHGRMSAQHDPRFPFYLGLSWIQDGQPQKPETAKDYLKEALVVAPQHPLPHQYLGLLLAGKGHWREAQPYFRQAAEADPTYPDPQLQYARSLEKTGDLAGAKNQLGDYYFLKDDPYRAAAAFREMTQVAPKDLQAPLLVSLAYMRLGRNDWAIRETRAALQQHPRDVALLERLAMLYILTHSRPLARRTCEEWLKIEADASRAHWLLGRVAQDDLRPTEAIREYERALAGDPNNPEYSDALGKALNDAGGTVNLRRAAGLLQTAVSQAPSDAAYRHDLGMTWLQLGDLEGARRQFLAALDREPHHTASFSGISQLCIRLRQPAMARFFGPLVRAEQDRSREELRVSRQIGQNPTSPEAHYAMARFLVRMAVFPSAQSHLERALDLRPDYPEARADLDHVKRQIEVR